MVDVLKSVILFSVSAAFPKGHLSHGERWPFMLTPRTGCRGVAPCQPFMLSAASFLYMAGVMPFIFLKVRLKLTALVYPTSS